MGNLENLEAVIHSPAFAEHIVVEKILPAEEGSYAPFPPSLDKRLAGALRRRGISAIYTHQRDVWEAVMGGSHTAAVTPTASGKTLCYNLPVLHTLLSDEHARALYLFPTKALSQDQQAELNNLVEDELPIRIVTYDGDTPESLRIAARDKGRIVISNPDMLHTGILPNHPRWSRFFSNLKFVVIDEIHAYRGVFGSHVANVIRRLKRIASQHGSNPRFILSSATIGNPRELAETLIGEPVVLSDKNGAPRGEKRIILYNPPLLDSVQGIRESVITESRRWTLAFLKGGIKTILFAHSRVKTEVAAAYVNEDLANLYTENSRIRVEPYRGGLLPNERREIEKGLREGTIQGVVSTNALELGIDIGGLDASVVAGFPGSFNSFWQQSGRAGRRGGVSAAVFVASSSPLDQYILRNPDWFFRKSAEEARLDPDNPYILTDHVKAAAFEIPFRDVKLSLASGETANNAEERDPFGEGAAEVLSFLEESGIVRHTRGGWHWADRSYPAEGVSLRSASADNVIIVDATKGRNQVIGEMDRPSAKELVFPNAVYIHRGRQYLVEVLDIPNRRCLVREASVNYFTDGLVKTDIKVLSEDEYFHYPSNEDEGGDPQSRFCEGVLGDMLVRTQTTKFKKIRFHTHENIGYGDIDLPEEEMQTRALALLFPPETRGGRVLAELEDDARAGAILSGAGTLLRMIAPILLLCDPRDIGLAERVRDPHFGVPCLYIYDKYPGGTGLAEALAGKITPLFGALRGAVSSCPCAEGCPSCVGPGGDKGGTVSFLQALDPPQDAR